MVDRNFVGLFVSIWGKSGRGLPVDRSKGALHTESSLSILNGRSVEPCNGNVNSKDVRVRLLRVETLAIVISGLMSGLGSSLTL